MMGTWYQSEQTLRDNAQAENELFFGADSGVSVGNLAAVQAAIAAEVQPVHIPRERPAVATVDERPLILVETKRDLRNIELPFERSDNTV